jgi:hypothetical protein
MIRCALGLLAAAMALTMGYVAAFAATFGGAAIGCPAEHQTAGYQ